MIKGFLCILAFLSLSLPAITKEVNESVLKSCGVDVSRSDFGSARITVNTRCEKAHLFDELHEKVDESLFDGEIYLTYKMVGFHSFHQAKNKQVNKNLLKYLKEQEGVKEFSGKVLLYNSLYKEVFLGKLSYFSWFVDLKSFFSMYGCEITSFPGFDSIGDGRMYLVKRSKLLDIYGLTSDNLNKEYYSIGFEYNAVLNCN